MYVFQCTTLSTLNEALVSMQSYKESGSTTPHLLFSYEDLPVPHIKIPKPEFDVNDTEFSDEVVRGMLMRLTALDWLKANGHHRVLYVDIDTLFLKNIDRLDVVNINDNWIAAAKENFNDHLYADLYESEYPEEEARRKAINKIYFNSGVLMIDLHKINFSFVKEYSGFGRKYPDQDYLNSLMPHYAQLPREFNCIMEIRVPHLLETRRLVEIRKELEESSICHFAGVNKPYTLGLGTDVFSLQMPINLYAEFVKRTEGVSKEFLETVMNNQSRVDILNRITDLVK